MKAKFDFRTCGWIAAAFAAGVFGICCLPARAQTNYGYYDPGANSEPVPAKAAPAKTPAPKAPANQAETCFSSQQSTVGGGVQETTCTQTKDGRQSQSRSIQMTTAGGGPGSKYQEQDETVQVDSETTRTTKTLLAPDSEGNLKPIRVTVEETRKLPGGEESVLRTISTPDMNGRLRVEQEQVTETTSKGPNEQEKRTTMLMPGPTGQLEPVIKTDEVQQKKGGEVETRTTEMRPNGNGGWAPSLVQETVKTPGEHGASTEEQKLYQVNPEGQLQLAQRKTTREWTDENGEQKSVVETHSANYPGANEYQAGKLGLVERVSTTRKTGEDGAQEVQRKIETGNFAAPWEGLTVSGQINETMRLTGDGRAETTREVLGPDGNGRLTQISVFAGQEPSKQATPPPEEKKAQPSGKQNGKGGGESPKGEQK